MKTKLLAVLSLIPVISPLAGVSQTQSVVTGNTAFALNLYCQISTNAGNLFLSPYSISTCLAMLYAGAAGNTAQQMSQVLGFGTDQPQFAFAFGQLQAQLQAEQTPGEVELDIANALWVQEGFPWLPAFLQTVTNQYQANCGQADFLTQAPEVTDEINQWVAAETKNKIQNIVPPGVINAYTRLVLANAIYFLGGWTYPFAETNTETKPFYLSSTSLVQAPLMHQPLLQAPGPGGSVQTVAFRYMQSYPTFFPSGSSSEFQALELPYGTNQLSMLILLPSQPDGLRALEQQLSPAFLSNVLAQMRPQPIEYSLPRFTLEYSLDLSQLLQAMGMTDAFRPFVADFSGIDVGQDLYVGFALHKAWGQVDEKGTEAAAATVIGVATSAPLPIFRADHPFLFLIRDTQTGSLLFLGRLVNPTSAGAAPTPALSLTPSAGNLRLSWPAALPLTLQQSPDLLHWTSVGGISTEGTNRCVTNAISSDGNMYFRLR